MSLKVVTSHPSFDLTSKGFLATSYQANGSKQVGANTVRFLEAMKSEVLSVIMNG